jgi:formylglycine-generating enzyme required for sulfatase activity
MTLLGRSSILLMILGALAPQDTREAAKPESAPARPAALASYGETIPGSTATLRMIALPAGGAAEPALWMSATEVTWDAYDIFVFGLDEDGAPKTVDAYSRPSKPYVPPDRGFGHAGFPAIGMSAQGALEFCKWLAKKTGRRYRLPTEAEWERACRAGTEDELAGDPERLAEHAWFSLNAQGRTHAVATRKPNAFGLYDMLGNACEYVTTSTKPTTCGGHYKLDAEACRPGARLAPARAWNSSDPQVPKSKWWLADCSWAGFRIVRDP